jgi:hypothetical protein
VRAVLDDVGDGLEVVPAFGTVGGFSGVKLGCVFAYEGMARHEADEGGAGVAGSTSCPFDGWGKLPCRRRGKG